MLTNQINRVVVRNFRSLGDVEIDLEDLIVLVGKNGSGKSNFLDALRFVSDALRHGVDAALINHDRGGIGAVRRYSSKGRPYDVAIHINLTLNDTAITYGFTLGSQKRNEYVVKNETCVIGESEYGYEIRDGSLMTYVLPGEAKGIAIQEKNLALPLLGNLREFEPLYNFLTNMSFYSIFPNDLRSPQRPGNSYPLDEHGTNLATVLREFVKNKAHQWHDDLYHALAQVVPGITPNNPITVNQVGSYLVVKIKHEDDSGSFDLAVESDGTLRILGLLTAIYQTPALPFIGIEEPELMIHPRAMGILSDILKEAAHRSQIILTTHSPDLISGFSADSLRLVKHEQGVTKISTLGDDERQIIDDELFGGGDLLRIGGLASD